MSVPSENTERVRDLVRAHGAFIARSVRRLGVPESVADDVSQRVFLTATRKLEAIEPQRERAYLFGIALRMANDARKSWRRGRLRAADSATDVEDLASSQGSPEELLERKRQRELLTSVVNALPAKERTVFVLHEFEGFNVSEIAERLELPAGTVTSQLRRARLRFEAGLKRFRARQASAASTWLLLPIPWLLGLRRWFPTKPAATTVATNGATLSSAVSLSGVASWIGIGAAGTGLLLAGAVHTASSATPSDTRNAATARTAPALIAARERQALPPPSASASSARDSTRVVSQPAASARAGVVLAPQLAASTASPARSAVAQVAPSLQRELSLLRATRALLAADDVVGALDLLERYKQLPGPHALAQEAQVLGVEALVARGARRVARAQGADYLERHPQSPQAPAVERLVGEP